MNETLKVLLILTLRLNLSAQNVIIIPELEVDSTELKITQSDFEYYAYSSIDNSKVDSLVISISTVGVTTTAISIDLTKKPKVYVSLYSDSPDYDGKHTLDVGFEYYDLEINATEFKKGDRVMGRIKGRSKIIPNSSNGYQIEFEGEFSHIIGKLMIKKRAEQSYRIMDNE